MLLSALFKDMTVVMALVPVVIIPLMLTGGFFTNLNNVPKVFYALEYISMFKYGWQAYIENNYRHDIICADGTTCNILTTKYMFHVRSINNLASILVEFSADACDWRCHEAYSLRCLVLLK
jgi:ABC-type multidrug transport system permease subunit